jgi:hypothetical protein
MELCSLRLDEASLLGWKKVALLDWSGLAFCLLSPLAQLSFHSMLRKLALFVRNTPFHIRCAHISLRLD